MTKESFSANIFISIYLRDNFKLKLILTQTPMVLSFQAVPLLLERDMVITRRLGRPRMGKNEGVLSNICRTFLKFYLLWHSVATCVRARININFFHQQKHNKVIICRCPGSCSSSWQHKRRQSVIHHWGSVATATERVNKMQRTNESIAHISLQMFCTTNVIFFKVITS